MACKDAYRKKQPEVELILTEDRVGELLHRLWSEHQSRDKAPPPEATEDKPNDGALLT